MINFHNQYQQLFNETANNPKTVGASSNNVSNNVHLKKEYFENRLRLQYFHKSNIDITKPLLAERRQCGTVKQIFIVPKQDVKETKNRQKMRRHSSVELYTSDIPVFPAVVQSYRYHGNSSDNNGEESNC